ncbi:hypothetical protein LCGC14_0303500 [marine sediment metagenome]|uniref:Uncharacterized protein n=1 Tax=marine sediment metagenome TaxID=412755 RepID=A0A0F9TUR2_9ZZZZ
MHIVFIDIRQDVFMTDPVDSLDSFFTNMTIFQWIPIIVVSLSLVFIILFNKGIIKWT